MKKEDLKDDILIEFKPEDSKNTKTLKTMLILVVCSIIFKELLKDMVENE